VRSDCDQDAGYEEYNNAAARDVVVEADASDEMDTADKTEGNDDCMVLVI